MAATSSPDGLQLRSKPKISARLNRKAVFVLVGVGAAVMLFVMTSVMNAKPPSAAKGKDPKERTRIVSAPSADITGEVPDSASRVITPPPPPPEVPPLEQPKGGAPALPAAKAQEPQKASQQDQELAQALRSGTALVEFAAQAAQAAPPNAAGASAPRRDRDSADIGMPAAGEADINRQSQKREFLERAAQDNEAGYRIARPRAALSPFEIKTGSIIPAVLVTAINSDLPGEIVAQVSENVYDSSTGRHLLVPQGTKLFGRYDSAVSFGQERLMVAWQRLIYPDASTLELAGMAGIDKQGQAGFSDQVNNHWMRTFGAAILTSLFTAGVQLSQPQPAPGSAAALTPQQVAAASFGQQMGQFGMAIASRNLQVQPTIEIRRGHKFAVMVRSDLVFPAPYGEKSPD